MVTAGEKLAALRSGKLYEFAFNSHPKCPHCGDRYDVYENEAWQLFDDNINHTVECQQCRNEFQVVSHSRWTFSTDEQEEDE